MFDNLLGNVKAQQEALQKELKEMIIQHESADKEISIEVNANGDLLDLSINDEFYNQCEREQLEDLFVNELQIVMTKAKAKQEEASQSILKDILPGGMGLDNLFG